MQARNNSGPLPFLCVATLLFAIALRVTESALNLGYFFDETTLQRATYRFFTELNFTTVPACNMFPFGPELSVKPFALWPSVLPWFWRGNLFQVRELYATCCLCQFFAIAALAFRRLRQPHFAIAALFAILLSLRLPYWHGFIQGMGELAGALWLATGFLLLQRRPAAAAFCWGLAVWHCKFIYLPAVFLFSVAWMFQMGPRQWKPIARFGLCFLLPLALWMLLITLRFNLPTLGGWLLRSFSFLNGNGSGVQQDRTSIPLIARLSAPSLEWVHYPIGLKGKILALLFIPCALIPGGLRLRWLALGNLEGKLLAAVPPILLGYAAWWFGMSPAMPARHIQPALYIGFASLLYLLFRFRKGGRLLLGLALALALAEAGITLRSGNWSPPDPIAKACRGTPENPACGEG